MQLLHLPNDAAFAAKLQEETIICRDLANFISDGSLYAWKLFYSGEAEKCLTKNSMKALEKVIKSVEKEEENKVAQKGYY